MQEILFGPLVIRSVRSTRVHIGGTKWGTTSIGPNVVSMVDTTSLTSSSLRASHLKACAFPPWPRIRATSGATKGSVLCIRPSRLSSSNTVQKVGIITKFFLVSPTYTGYITGGCKPLCNSTTSGFSCWFSSHKCWTHVRRMGARCDLYLRLRQGTPEALAYHLLQNKLFRQSCCQRCQCRQDC